MYKRFEVQFPFTPKTDIFFDLIINNYHQERALNIETFSKKKNFIKKKKLIISIIIITIHIVKKSLRTQLCFLLLSVSIGNKELKFPFFIITIRLSKIKKKYEKQVYNRFLHHFHFIQLLQFLKSPRLVTSCRPYLLLFIVFIFRSSTSH